MLIQNWLWCAIWVIKMRIESKMQAKTIRLKQFFRLIKKSVVTLLCVLVVGCSSLPRGKGDDSFMIGMRCKDCSEELRREKKLGYIYLGPVEVPNDGCVDWFEFGYLDIFSFSIDWKPFDNKGDVLHITPEIVGNIMFVRKPANFIELRPGNIKISFTFDRITKRFKTWVPAMICSSNDTKCPPGGYYKGGWLDDESSEPLQVEIVGTVPENMSKNGDTMAICAKGEPKQSSDFSLVIYTSNKLSDVPIFDNVGWIE